MQVERLLHKILKESSVIGHEKRRMCLLRSVESVLHNGKLSLTDIGRHLKGSAKVKNKIKSVDKLVGNTRLMMERAAIYEVITRRLLEGLREAVIIIDWSPCASHENQLLKASVMMSGRSMTLYEEVHPEKKLGNNAVHKQFMRRLKRMLPEGVKIIIETDAGFRTDWFKWVVEMGWEFIGRVRSNMLFCYEGEEEWFPCLSVFSQATSRVKFLGDVRLSKKRSLPASMYLYHENKVRKKKPTKVKRKIKLGKMNSSYSRGNKEPWLLVTSLRGGEKSANRIIGHYRNRMRIEHEFRNTKNSRWGVGLEYTLTRNLERLQILLLIGYLAIFILWLTGLAAELKNLQYNYQANTIRKHRVLSLVFLGLQIILHEPNSITKMDIINAFAKVRAIRGK